MVDLRLGRLHFVLACLYRPSISNPAPPIKAIQSHAMDALGYPLFSIDVNLASRFPMCRSCHR
jgi:hypothetical protein